MKTDRIAQLQKKAVEFYNNGDPGHDFAHIQRVMANCRWLCGLLGGNLEILLAAAILHDLVNLPKNHPERLKASEMAAANARESLTEVGFTAEEIEKISSVIVEHSYSLNRKPSSLESKILQDSDKLDALGAIGIMRAITCGTRMGSSYYHLEEPFSDKRPLDDKLFSIDHFYTKLLKLPALMNTPAAKAEGERRAEFMKSFLKELKSEISENIKS